MNKKTLAIGGAFLAVFLLFILLSYSFFIDSKINKNLEIKIDQGDSRVEIIDNLSKKLGLNALEKNYIKIFYFLNRAKIEAGSYTFKPETKFLTLLTGFNGANTQIKVTFLEGARIEENALVLKNLLGVDFAKEYYQKALSNIGYLYPDTYFVDSKTTPDNLIAKQIETFEAKTKNAFFQSNSKLSKEEIVNFASIVEREERNSENRKVVAGILIKRYLGNMSIDADATTQYGIGLKNYTPFVEKCLDGTCIKPIFWSNKITDKDLENTDGYNTRKVLGLPKTPISNPSLDSIEAVISPKDSPYYFYLHDSTGKTYFAKTYEEHVANIAKYL